MNQQVITVIAVVGGVMLIDLMIVPAILKAGWSTVADRFPARPILPDHIRRDFQSFAFGMFNFGLCVHAAADRDHLHLLPSALLRWAGCRSASIPWEQVRIVRRGGRWIEVRVGPTRIRGPRWCLELAGEASAAPGEA